MRSAGCKTNTSRCFADESDLSRAQQLKKENAAAQGQHFYLSAEEAVEHGIADTIV